MNATLGIDVGLSGARAAVMDRRSRLLGVGRSEAFEAGFESDPAIWLSAATQAARGALAAAGAPAIEAIGVGALGPCPVLLDDDLRPLGQASLFALDDRAESQRKLMRCQHGLSDEQLGPDHVLPKLQRLSRLSPDTVARARWVVDTTGYLVAALTGEVVMDPVTVCDHVIDGLPQPVRLPLIRPGTAIAGRVKAKAAAALGMAEGIPVTVGSYDSYVDIAGTGAWDEGDAAILLGSTMVLGCIAAEGIAPASLRATPHLGPGWFVGGWTSTAGSLLAWSRERNGAEATRAAAALPPGAGGLLMLPYFAGERAPHWDSAARGAILGATLATTAAELHRAAIDAVALSARDLTQRLQKGGFALATLRATGGGARDLAWSQAVSDATGLKLEIMADAGEAVGPASLAWRALGQVVPTAVERVVTPELRRQARYRALHALYEQAYPALAATLHGLGRLDDRSEVV